MRRKYKKKSNLTLLVSSEILKIVKHDAETEGMSLNQKVNTILTKWALLYRIASIEGGIWLPGLMWKEVLAKMDEKELVEILDYSQHIVPAILDQNDISLTLDNFIDYILNGTVLWAGNYSLFHYYYDPDERLTLIFEHSHGKKWSEIFGESMRRFLKNIFKLESQLQASPRIIKIKITGKA